jgi:hypothetical protein
MKARLRHLSRVLLRPVVVAVEPRLDVLETRLTARMEQVENHVGTDAEVAAELAVTQGRSLAAVEERLRRVEEKLDTLLEATARR